MRGQIPYLLTSQSDPALSVMAVPLRVGGTIFGAMAMTAPGTDPFSRTDLAVAQQLIEQRRRRGKSFGPSGRKTGGKLSASTLIRIYKQDVERKRMLVRKAEATRERLVFIVQGLKSLLADDDLIALLQTEGMDTLPKNLTLRMQGS